MRNTLSKILIFTAGAAIGSAVTWKILKVKYDRKVQDELNAITKSFLEDEDSDKIDIPTTVDNSVDAPDMYYEKIINDNEYDYHVDEEEEHNVDEPKVISLDDFEDGENPTMTLYYWADGVVTNDRGKIVANVDELIGIKNLRKFEDSRIDSIYIRNYESEIDYEILRDSREFSGSN